MGITGQELRNPRQPQREVGYVYVKPVKNPRPDTLVVYEAHDDWDGGVNVLFADGHVQFIGDEARFRKELAAAKAAAKEK